MSNNIYDILKKFNSLDSVKNMLTEGKKVCKDCGEAKCKCLDEGKKPDLNGDGKNDFEDVKIARYKASAKSAKGKGAIAEAVARVEQQLAEKYMGFKKMREGVRPVGTITPTDQGDEYTPQPGYRVKAEFEPGSTGKPKMGFVKDKSDQTGQGAKPAQPNTDTTPPAKEVNESEYNEDMLSPGQKKIARMSPPPDKIDAGDLAALRKTKKTNEGFPTVDDAKKHMDAKAGKTAHGTKTATKTGTKHERDWDREETGERGRPVKDKFAKK